MRHPESFSLTQIQPYTLHKPAFSFLTITEPVNGSYREKGSKFLAFAFPVEDEAAIQAELAALRKAHYDAHHHCYAWVLGPEGVQYRANDDGEPAHSAGDPILGQLRSRQLTNILVVVVRYFGGTKLGVGGLIHAYREAAADALNKASIIRKEVMFSMTIRYGFGSTPEVMKLIKEFDATIIAEQYDDTAVLQVNVPLKHREALVEKLELLKALKHEIDKRVP
jgi:uncharacterized YigZ family protein